MLIGKTETSTLTYEGSVAPRKVQNITVGLLFGETPKGLRARIISAEEVVKKK